MDTANLTAGFRRWMGITFLWMFFLGVALTAAAHASDVDIYAEGVIRESGLTVYVYSDVNVEQVVSYGVSLTYDAAELTAVSADKDPDPVPYTANTSKWYLGQDTADYRNNPEADLSVPGTVKLIGGRLDPEDPVRGMEPGTRILLAVVQFAAAGEEMPSAPVFSLSYAVGDGTSEYKNFVRISNDAPLVLDSTGVSFGTVRVCKEGDGDESGTVTPRDINMIKTNIGNENAPCYMDCDGNGRITPADINCVKSRI